MTHDEIARAWAIRSKSYAKGYAMILDGDSIYSWGRHYTIARHVTATDGTPVVLYNGSGYSPSTAKHSSHVRRAIIRAGLRSFTVCDPACSPSEADVWSYVNQASEAADKAARARTYRELHLRDASGLLETAHEFAAAFGLPAPDAAQVEAVRAKMTAVEPYKLAA